MSRTAEPAAARPAGSGGGDVARDAVAGLVAGLYSIPEGIGYAQLAGMPPMLGVYAGMAPVAGSAVTTGSVLMISTLTSAIALTTKGVLESADLTGNTQAVFTLMLELNAATGASLVIVTHDPAIAERTRRILKLEDGVLRPA